MDLLIFDLDGVLIDSEVLAARAIADVLHDDGFPVSAEEMIERFVGVSNARVIDVLSHEHGRPIAEDFIDRAMAAMAALFEAELAPIPGAPETLPKLSAPKCVASNSPPDYVARALDLTDLRAHFDGAALFSAAMVDRPKPAPDLFLHAADWAGVAAGDCLVIEDSIAGVEAARAAGMAVYGFVGAGHLRDPKAHAERLARHGARQVFHDFRDLPALLEEHLVG